MMEQVFAVASAGGVTFSLHARCTPNGAADGPDIDGTDKLERLSKNGASVPPGKATVGELG